MAGDAETDAFVISMPDSVSQPDNRAVARDYKPFTRPEKKRRIKYSPRRADISDSGLGTVVLMKNHRQNFGRPRNCVNNFVFRALLT